MLWDSVLMFVVPTISTAALIVHRSRSGHARRMALTVTLLSPAPVVFDLLDDLSRFPVWHRRPSWLPRSLRIGAMSHWGEFVPAASQEAPGTEPSTRDIRIRQIRNREIGCSWLHKNGFLFESTFRITPDSGKCFLTWEVSYRSPRLPDILNRRKIAAAVHRTMAESLEDIRRLALHSQAPIRIHNRIVADSRDQMPAA